jgi:hypothetical protein
MAIGKMPPSITASLWSGKVPHLRAYALNSAQQQFMLGHGAFLRRGMARYLQDRVLRALYIEIPTMCRPFRKACEDLALNEATTVVRLVNAKLTVTEMRLLAVFLQCDNQVEVNLSYNALGAEVVRPLVPHMTSHPALRVLNLGFSRLGDAGVAVVAAAVATNPLLLTLDLTSSAFKDEGCDALSAMLCVNTALRTLHIGYNDLRYTGAERLCEGIATNRGLKYLNLRWALPLRHWGHVGCHTPQAAWSTHSLWMHAVPVATEPKAPGPGPL